MDCSFIKVWRAEIQLPSRDSLWRLGSLIRAFKAVLLSGYITLKTPILSLIPCSSRLPDAELVLIMSFEPSFSLGEDLIESMERSLLLSLLFALGLRLLTFGPNDAT